MAAQVVSGNVTLNASFTQTNSTGLVTPISAAALAQVTTTLQNLTGMPNGVDTLYANQLTLAAAATHINLFSATDILGDTVVFARVRFWIVQNITVTAGKLCNVYTRTGTDPVTWLPVTTSAALWAPPGGLVCGYDPISTSTNGYVVGSGAFDFTVDPGANTCVVNVIIAGNSAA